jgi:peptide/nickel transport system substrate-binding protein
MGRSTLRLLSALLALSLLAAACGGGGDDAADDGPTDGSGDTADGTDGTEDSGQSDADDGDGTAADSGVGTEDIDEPDDTPVPGGVLRFGLNSEDDGLNPTSSRLSAPGLTIASAVFDTLTAFDKDGNAVPYLAKSVTPNDDFTVWTIELRDGIKFHDDTDLDADAAIKTLELQRKDLTIGLAVRNFVKLGKPFVKVDDLTFEIHLSEPWRFFPAFMAGLQFGMIASPTWLDAAAEDPTLNQEPVGTGPFRFESRVQDLETRLVRNDDYWNGPVYLDAIEFVIVPDGETRTTLLLENQLDGMHTNEAEAIEVLRSETGIQNALDDTGDEQLDLINTSVPPFDDIRARQALTFASPQNNYITLLGAGQVRRADQMFEPGSPFHNPSVVQETDQPDKAVALAAEYCADNPDNCTNNKIDMVRQTSGPTVGQTREAELIAQGWQVAFNVTLESIPLDDHVQSVIFGQYQVADWRQFGAVDPSEDNVWLLCKTATAGLALNFTRSCDAERDRLLTEAQNEPDPEKRAELYQQVSAAVQQSYAYIFWAHTLWDIALHDDVRGVCSRTSLEGVPLRCQINGRPFFDKTWLSG